MRRRRLQCKRLNAGRVWNIASERTNESTGGRVKPATATTTTTIKALATPAEQYNTRAHTVSANVGVGAKLPQVACKWQLEGLAASSSSHASRFLLVIVVVVFYFLSTAPDPLRFWRCCCCNRYSCCTLIDPFRVARAAFRLNRQKWTQTCACRRLEHARSANVCPTNTHTSNLFVSCCAKLAAAHWWSHQPAHSHYYAINGHQISSNKLNSSSSSSSCSTFCSFFTFTRECIILSRSTQQPTVLLLVRPQTNCSHALTRNQLLLLPQTHSQADGIFVSQQPRASKTRHKHTRVQ